MAGEAITGEEPVQTEEDLFTWRTTMVELGEPVEGEEEDEDEDRDSKKTKKKKKKKKFVEVEYDPDRDVVIAKKMHKRGGWSDDWEL